MDPAGPWYTSYNRLATTPGMISTFQTTTPSSNQLSSSVTQTGTSASSSVVLQESANSTATLAGQQSPFNPGGFITTSSAVGYDVFSPSFFNQSNKETNSNYVAHHVQPVAGTQAAANSKPNSPEESDIPSLRNNYTSPEQNESFFDHQTSTTSPPTASWTLSNPSTTKQSPFGILPHESIAVSSPPGPPVTAKTANVSYDNPYGTHYSSNGTAPTGADPKTGVWSASDVTTKSRSQSPKISKESSISGAHTYFQATNTYKSNGLSSGYTAENQSTTNAPVVQASLHHQSCIVTAPNLNLSNRIPQMSSRSPVPTTHFLNVPPQDKQTVSGNDHLLSDPNHDNSQSSPISFSMMDSRNINYNTANSANKQQTPNSTVQTFHVLNQQPPQQQSSCRLYSNTADSDYHHPVRSKSSASTDSAYSSNTSQNGPDSRSSSLQTHSQASPLGHVPSPATYPMYNSPMASMSSPSPLQAQHSEGSSGTPFKTSNVQQQMTPPSPHSVTVTRSPSQQVGYSSVITRASNETNKTYNTEASPMCWDNDRQQASGNSNYISTGNSEQNVLSGNQPMRILNVVDRPNCLESSQINMQDLNSCSGNPLPTSNELQTNEENHKSLDKVGGSIVNSIPVENYSNRIPPPAHHNSVVNQLPDQQQQNGYLEIERWQTLPQTKLITSAPTFIPQPQQQPMQIHHTTNIVTNAVVSHPPQQLLVMHQPSQPVSYFPTFPTNSHVLPMQQTQPQWNPMDMNMMDNSCQQNMMYAQNSLNDKPQVFVPNIEEELDFLQQPGIPGGAMNPLHQAYNSERRNFSNDPSTGFMTSYLKFLNGGKDTSPPPALREGKKASWNNNRRPYMLDQNGLDSWSKGNLLPPTSSDKSKNAPSIDYENDPRYFPLPKERKKRSFDSSDDGFSSDGNLSPLVSKNKIPKVPKQKKVRKSDPSVPGEVKKKGRPIKPGSATDRKRKAEAAAAAAAAEAAAKGIVLPPPEKEVKKKVSQLPRRETSKRRAKEKTSEILEQQKSTTDPYEDEEAGDSDNDPAWTPAAKSSGDDEDKRKKRGRLFIGKRKKLLDDNDFLGLKKGKKKRNQIDPNARSNAIRVSCKIDEKLLASNCDEEIDISPFKAGEFVVMKSDLDQEYPPLWRIDGKTLLQKYEPFISNGKTLYRNISTYSGWSPQNRYNYQQVSVKYWTQDKMETVVEFLRDELIEENKECITRYIKETEKFQDNFEVYIQTLISQALDSNFLTEILLEKDEYFLSNVKTVDEITEENKQRLLSTTSWQNNVVNALSTWPCTNVLKDNMGDYKGKTCSGCSRTKIYSRVLLYGQPYNSTTLEGSPPDPQVPQEKDFIFCRICQTKVDLFNKVAHQKYLMFLECARRVAEKRLADPNKDTTIILNELLADEAWLNQLFGEVRNIWAEIVNIQEQSLKKKAASSAASNAGPSTSLDNIPDTSQFSSESQTQYSNQMNGSLC